MEHSKIRQELIRYSSEQLEKSLPESPLVSVIIPAYNAESLIQKTLNSVLSQTYKNLEVLVVDDDSLDRTVEIVKAIAQQDGRVTLLQQQNSGAAAARNLGIEKSKGELIAPIDADDIWYPENIEKQVQCLLKNYHLGVGVVYAWSADIDEQDFLTGGLRVSKIEGKVYQTLIGHNFISNASASLIRRICIDRVGGYSTQMKQQNAQGCEDWDLYIRIAEHYQFKVVPEFLIGYRQLDSSMSCDYIKMAASHAVMLQNIQEKHPEISSVLYRFSSSSFYMYLARKSSQHQDYRSTLFWLYQAVKADWLTPFLRFGLYSLLIKSLLGLIGEEILPKPLLSKAKQYHTTKPANYLNKEDKQLVITLDYLEKKKLGIQLRLLVTTVLHQLLQIIPTK